MSSDFWQIVLAVVLFGGVIGIFIVLPIVYMLTGPHFRHDDEGPAVVPTLMTLSLTTTQLAGQGQAATESLTEMLHSPTQRMDTPEETLQKLAQKNDEDHEHDLDALTTLADQSHDEALEEAEALRKRLADPVPVELPPSNDEAPA